MKPYSSGNISTTNLAPPISNSASRQQSRQSSPSNPGIRSRNKKLGLSNQDLIRKCPASTPGGSRTVSPISTNCNSLDEEAIQPLRKGLVRCDHNSSESFVSAISKKSIWDGLNALQEIAFSMIADTNDSDSRQVQVHKKKDRVRNGRTRNEWGPEAGLPQKNKARNETGTTEDKAGKVSEIRKISLLEGRDGVTSMVGETERFKRRTSNDEVKPGCLEYEGFTLVYIHNVQPQDTIQGVVLKFHSQMDIFKKTNRFWAGDSIQLRDKVFLPVDACAIKGKPCSPPHPDPPLDSVSPCSSQDLNESSFYNYGSWKNGKSIENPESTQNHDDNEAPWTHVRWVVLETSPSTPVQVVRIPRKTLNYFPPRRRKSLTTVSITSTPRISSEIPSLCRSSNDSQRNSISHNFSFAGHRSPVVNNSSLSRQLSSSDIRESISEVPNRCGWLQGPGGVGTLGKDVRKPGPATDVLNSWTRKRFPGIAIDSLPSTSVVGADSAKLSVNSEEISSTAAESALTHSLQMSNNGGLAFPNVNLNRVESWVRKMATKVQVPRNSKEDAIEMLDGTGSDDGRNYELAIGRSSLVPSRGRIREAGFESTIRERGKSRKSEKRE